MPKPRRINRKSGPRAVDDFCAAVENARFGNLTENERLAALATIPAYPGNRVVREFLEREKKARGEIDATFYREVASGIEFAQRNVIAGTIDLEPVDPDGLKLLYAWYFAKRDENPNAATVSGTEEEWRLRNFMGGFPSPRWSNFHQKVKEAFPSKDWGSTLKRAAKDLGLEFSDLDLGK